MLVGATHGVGVGAVEADHGAEVDALAAELVRAGAAALGVEAAVDADTAPDRLRARAAGAETNRKRFPPGGVADIRRRYARAVAHFPTAVKEFEWRNGWFYKLTYDAVKAGTEDPIPTHTQLLYDLQLPLPVAWLAKDE